LFLIDSPPEALVSAVFKLATSASFELFATGNELVLLMEADWAGLLVELSWVAYGLFDFLSSIMLFYYNICRYAS